MPDVTELPLWVEIVKSLGFPIFVAMVLMFGMWKIARFVANNVVMPITQAHLTFIKTTCDSQTKQADAMEQQSATLREIAATQDKMAETQDKQTDLLETMSTANRRRA